MANTLAELVADAKKFHSDAKKFQRRRPLKQRSVTAYHEAGHAVAAILFGHDFAHVDIIPDATSLGRIIYEDAPEDVQEARAASDYGDARLAQWIEHSLIITLAGSLAQRRHAPRSHWRHGRGENGTGELVSQGSDVQTVMRRIDDLHNYNANPKVAAAYERYVTAQAEALVTANWPKITQVAEALLSEEFLMEDEVRALMFPEYAKAIDRRSFSGVRCRVIGRRRGPGAKSLVTDNTKPGSREPPGFAGH